MKILRMPGAAPEGNRIRVHLLCVGGSILLLAVGPYLPRLIQPVHLCIGTVIFLALSRPSWTDLISVFLYGVWMDALFSWFKGYALILMVVYVSIQALLRIVRVNSVATRTAVGAGTFTVVWLARWLLSLAFGSEGDFFRLGWLVLQPFLGAGWTLLCFILYEWVAGWRKERALTLKAR